MKIKKIAIKCLDYCDHISDNNPNGDIRNFGCIYKEGDKRKNIKICEYYKECDEKKHIVTLTINFKPSKIKKRAPHICESCIYFLTHEKFFLDKRRKKTVSAEGICQKWNSFIKNKENGNCLAWENN